MGYCAALNCKSRTSEGIRLFRFPKDKKRRAQWVQNCRRDKWQPRDNSVLCEYHFEESQFEQRRADGRKLLKWNSIPTIFNVPDPPESLKCARKPPNERVFSCKASNTAEPTDDKTKLRPSEKCKEVSRNDNGDAKVQNGNIFDSANDGDVDDTIMENDEVWEYSNELCRLCVTIGHPKQPIKGWIGIIEDIIPDTVKLDDGLPQHVCYSCSRKLNTCLLIKHEFLSACDKLKSIRSSNVYFESQLGNDNYQVVYLLAEDTVRKESYSVEDGISIPEGHFSPDVVTDQNETGASCAEHSTDDKEFIDEANSCNQTEAEISCSGYSSLDVNTAEDHSASKLPKPVTSQVSVLHQINPTVPCASTSGDHKSQTVSHEVIINVENKTNISASKKCCAANNVSLQARPLFKTGEKNCIYSYICSECESIFTSKSVLVKHVLNEHNPLKCKICKKRYNRKNTFEIHMLTHAQGKISCIKCDQTFRTEKYLSVHLDLHDPPKFACPTCGRKFNVKGKMISHMKLHNLSMQQVCTVCGKYLKDKTSLEVHMRLHTGEKPFQCQFCGKAFSSHGALNGHEKFHKGPAYLCSHCGAQFHHVNHYNKHLVLHLVDYQNECPVCFLNFRLPKYRDKHYNSLCSKKCFCIVCNQKFQDFDSLVAHRSNSHTKEDLQTAIEKYKEVHIVHCSICSMEVHGKSGMVLHMRKAHGVLKKSSKHDLLEV